MKTKPPILPGNLNDPTGADRLERGAINEFGRRIKRIAKAYQDILDRITEQTGIEISRAKRIARTEIPTALRRARWDETDEAEAQYGIMTRQMHLSAFSPTTRRRHALRHAHLYTTEEVRDWYSVDGNAIIRHI